jgi:hypothetical protein
MCCAATLGLAVQIQVDVGVPRIFRVVYCRNLALNAHMPLVECLLPHSVNCSCVLRTTMTIV